METTEKWMGNVKEDMEQGNFISNDPWPSYKTESSGDVSGSSLIVILKMMEERKEGR